MNKSFTKKEMIAKIVRRLKSDNTLLSRVANNITGDLVIFNTTSKKYDVVPDGVF